jgi:hypothetical protein
MKEQHLKGFWWLPNRKELLVGGELDIDRNAAPVLSLIGCFENDLSSIERDLLASPEFILGLTSDGTRVTLVRCFRVESKINFPGFATSRYQAELVFVGEHFESASSLHFRSLHVSYDLLDEWAQIRALKADLRSDDNRKLESLTVAYTPPRVPEAHLSGATVRFKTKFSFSPNRASDMRLKTCTFVELEAASPMPFDELLERMREIRNFISLGADIPAYEMDVCAEREKSVVIQAPGVLDDPRESEEIMQEARRLSLRPNSIRIFYRRAIRAEESSYSSTRALFELSEIEGELELFLRKWLQINDSLRPVVNMYFGVRDSDSQYLEVKFLLLVQSVEYYHRHRIRRKAHLDARVREVIASLHGIADTIISDHAVFAKTVAKTRDYLTHYDPELEAQAAESYDLYYLMQRLRIIIELLLLRELGFSNQKLLSVVTMHERYRGLHEKAVLK